MTIDNLQGSIGDNGTELFSRQNIDTKFDSIPQSTTKATWLSDFFEQKDNIYKEPKWKFEQNNFYASGQSVSYFGAGLFSDLGLEHRLSIAGLPMKISGGLVFQNGQINTRLSTIGVEFDYEAVIQRYKAEVAEKTIQESFDNLQSDKQKILQEYHSIEASRQVIYSDGYALRKNVLAKNIDSLSGILQSRKDLVHLDLVRGFESTSDSLHSDFKTGRDSVVLDSLQSLQGEFHKYEHKVDSIYNKGRDKWKEAEQILQTWKTEIAERQTVLEEKIEVGTLPNYKKGGIGNDKWKSLMLKISGFKLGSYRLQGSGFEVSSVPLHGVALEIRRKGYFGAVSYGKEGRQNSQLPDYVRNIRLAGEGRTILQAKAGIGMPERSHLHLIFTSIKLSGSADSNYLAFPKSNVLVSIESRYQVSKQFFVEMTGTLSNADFTGTASNKELLGTIYDDNNQDNNKLAGLARFGWSDKHGNSTYSFGYQSVGSNFVSLGNLYLLTNRNAIKIEGRQKFLQKRGQLKASYTKGASNNNASDIAPSVQQNQVSAEISYRINKRGGRAWASYSPSFFVQNAPGASVAVYQLNLTTLGTQWLFPKGRNGQWMTVLQATNYADQSRYGDSSVVTGLWYGMLTQTYVASKYSITALANVGMDEQNLKLVRDLNLDLSQSFNLKNIQISQGAQVVKRFYGSGILIGGSGGVQIKVHKGLRAGISGTYLVGITNGAENQFYMNSSASWQF